MSRDGGGYFLCVRVVFVLWPVVPRGEFGPLMIPQRPVEGVALDEPAKGLQVFALIDLHGRVEIIHIFKAANLIVEAHDLKLAIAGGHQSRRTIERDGFVEPRQFARAPNISVRTLGIKSVGTFRIAERRMGLCVPPLSLLT